MGNSEYRDQPNVLRELILDHYQYPHHHKLVRAETYQSVHMASDSCIDDITVEARIADGKILDINFEGAACAISTASTSMMSDLLIGKTKEEAQALITNFLHMVHEEEYNPDTLEEAIALKNVYRQANRIKCATIGWTAIQKLLEKEDENGRK
ncbi:MULTISPECIES: Fe-S cluster assembly sulfur transfer protein SufU [Terrabacteria group]|uniref:Fe-S cluster assembly sulfur transfer protein SufU n=1 Tax=Bacillati TaxID=1783272 RepID=UPI0019396984|nr:MULTISPECIES: SUF system NifU family Fe-S cluster assembly protein [Terrabacteria group]MBW9212361.1 SUF system NifU family Fe-S cluster assembly protein [Trueperella sp. zg.1013]QRG86106.1 SUF system NifU family Fe-S cluster assembly protein [Bulleidia sp. zg-1006]